MVEYQLDGADELPENPEGFMGEETKIEAKKLATSVYDTSMTSISMALALTAALAWNDLIKHIIGSYVRIERNSIVYFLIYAIIVTILFAVVHSIIKKYAGAKVIEVPITYAVTPK